MKMFGKYVLAAAIGFTAVSAPVAALAQDLYGAIAYSQKANRYGWAVDFSSQQEAENAALNECFNYGSDCKSIWFMNACGALAIGTDGGWGLNWGQNGRQAENKAVNQCTNVSSGCQPVFTKCVTGYN
jgi:serine/threonine-protein kinase